MHEIIPGCLFGQLIDQFMRFAFFHGSFPPFRSPLLLLRRRHRLDLAVDADLDGARLGRADGEISDLAVFPAGIDREVASGFHACERTFGGPGFGDGGDDGDLAGMGLHQHFADGADDAEVAVHLERRMVAEEIGHGVVGQQAAHHDAGPFAFAQPGPHGTAPGPCPGAAAVADGGVDAKGFAGLVFMVVAADFEGDDGGLGQIGRIGEVDLAAGIDGEQVRGMAVGVVLRVAVGLPFLELAPLADFIGGEILLHVGNLRLILGIDAERLGGIQVVLEQIPDQLLVVHHAIFARAVFRRPAVGGDQAAIRQFLQMVFPVFADFLDDGIGGLGQVIVVLGERPVLEDMLGIPGAGRDVPFPAIAAKDVLAGAGGPAAGLFAEGLAGGDAAGFLGGDDEIDQRHVAFGEVGRFGTPVVHLDIDVVVVVAGPGWRVAVVPQALQVGRQAARPRTAGEQVASILEHGFFQIRIGLAAGITL